MLLTDVQLKAIVKGMKPGDKEKTFKDGGGLFFVASPQWGNRWRYRFTYEGKEFKLILGRFPDMGLRAARNQRNEYARQLAEGKNPAEARQEQRAEEAVLTVQQFAQEFFREMVKRDRKKPEPELARWERDILPAIGQVKLDEFSVDTARDVIWQKKEEGFNQAAKLIRGSLKRFCEYAVTKGHLQYNPVLNIPSRHVAPNVSRERFLTWEEVAVFTQAIDGADISLSLRLALKLLLLTLARVGELRGACWADVHFDKAEWHVPPANSKNKRPHIVYLSRQAVAMFTELKMLAGESPFVLPGRWGRKPYAAPTFNNSLETVMQGQGVAKFTIHDLRRTGVTLLNEAGFAVNVIEKAANHTLKGIQGVYNRAEFAEARKDMLQNWADRLFPASNPGSL